MIQFFILVAAFLVGMLLFDYIKTRNLVRNRALEEDVGRANEKIAQLERRIQHLEAIVAEEENQREEA